MTTQSNNSNHYWPLILIFIGFALFFAKTAKAQRTTLPTQQEIYDALDNMDKTSNTVPNNTIDRHISNFTPTIEEVDRCPHCPSTSLTSGMNTLRPEVNDLPNPCLATTQDGQPCKRQAQAGDTKCWQHSDKTPRCNAPTKAGGKCKMGVKKEGDKCHHHDSEANKKKADSATKTKAT